MSLDSTSNAGPGLTEIAAQWLLREQGAGLSERKREQRDAWLEQSPSHRAAYDRARAVWDLSGQAAGEQELRAMRADALAARPRRRRRFLADVLAAGFVAAAFGLGGWYLIGHWSELTQQWRWAGLGEYRARYSTAVGERLTTTLLDGSSVSLNTGSDLAVDFSSTERRIYLRRGQAFFEVKRNARRPFVVIAGDRRIKALGTSFDVRVDDGRVQVLLLDGRVAVDRPNAPGGTVELTPGERLTAASAAPARIQAADMERLTSWHSGRLVFQDQSLADTVAELNRYTRETMRIDDPRVGALRVSAVFRISQADRFARSMTELFPLIAVQQPDGTLKLKFSTPVGED